MANMNSAMQQYKNIGSQAAVGDASPYQLIAMLYKGVLDNLAAAKGGMARHDVALKGEKIGRAIEIIDYLRATLDLDQGGDIAVNLRDLYSYMETRLLQANMESNTDMIDEVAGLMREIKLGWEAIPEDQRSVIQEGGQPR